MHPAAAAASRRRQPPRVLWHTCGLLLVRQPVCSIIAVGGLAVLLHLCADHAARVGGHRPPATGQVSHARPQVLCRAAAPAAGARLVSLGEVTGQCGEAGSSGRPGV